MLIMPFPQEGVGITLYVVSRKLFSSLKAYSLFLCSPKNFGEAYSHQVVRPSVRPEFVSSPLLRYLKSDSKTISQMITLLRRCVAEKIWVATLKVKVTLWPCSKIVSSQ